MPEVKMELTEEEMLQQEIAAMYPRLTGPDRRAVMVAINQSEDTIYRYATSKVKKLSTGILMRDAMRKVLADRVAA